MPRLQELAQPPPQKPVLVTHWWRAECENRYAASPGPKEEPEFLAGSIPLCGRAMKEIHSASKVQNEEQAREEP